MSVIPRVIHYCWFGKNPKSDVIERCISSWREHLSDYEIIEWNEDNFDIHSNRYVKEAYDQKKWAFVSDYVRLWAILHHGGIYLDTDVVVYRNLDKFLEHRAFCGFQDPFFFLTALFAAEKAHPWIQKLFDYYSNAKFLSVDGKPNLTTNVVVTTDIMLKDYGVSLTNKQQTLSDGLVIYPSYFFCIPKFNNKSESYTEHLFDGSWLDIPLWKRLLIKLFRSKGRYYFCLSYLMHYRRLLFCFFSSKRSSK